LVDILEKIITFLKLNMKLSIMKILSMAIALPFLSLIGVDPASAEQISRSRNTDDSITSVTDLNLEIPVDRQIAPKPNRQQSNTTKKSTPTEPTSPKIATNRSTKKTDSKSKIDSTISVNIQTPSVKVSVETPQPIELKKNSQLKSTSTRKIATNSLPPFTGNYLRLVKEPRQGSNQIGNPIYTLEAYINGVKYQSFKAVSGTATTQNRDRDVPDIFAPLPDGLYKVSHWVTPSNVPDVGNTFIGIYPQFATERTALGIHQDVSFNKRNGRDGTAGCIGLVSIADRDAVNSFVNKYQPRNLIVSIDPN
jgi:hypothetical protein